MLWDHWEGLMNRAEASMTIRAASGPSHIRKAVMPRMSISQVRHLTPAAVGRDLSVHLKLLASYSAMQRGKHLLLDSQQTACCR